MKGGGECIHHAWIFLFGLGCARISLRLSRRQFCRFGFSFFGVLVVRFVARFCPKNLGESWGKGVITLHKIIQPERKNP
jgi:hypothetical protein